MEGTPLSTGSLPALIAAPSSMVIGRYVVCDAIASGSIAAVHLGRLLGSAGFSRTVAIKRVHSHIVRDHDFASEVLAQAQLAARIQHPNIVSMNDVVVEADELLLVMEYIRGDSLSGILRKAEANGVRLPPGIAVTIILDLLAGLQAAHDAVGQHREPLGLVHCDVSPRKVMVGLDGTTRILDLATAKAEARLRATRQGDVTGTMRFMPREQLAGKPLTRAADVYSAGVILFEALTGTRMFGGESGTVAISGGVPMMDIRLPSHVDPSLEAFDSVILRATAAAPEARYPTAREMASEVENACPASPRTEVGEWVEWLAAERLQLHARLVAQIESLASRSLIPVPHSSARLPIAPHPDDRVVPSITGAVAAAPTAASSRGRAAATKQTLLSVVVVVMSLLLAGVGIGAMLLSRRPTTATPIPTAGTLPALVPPVVTTGVTAQTAAPTALASSTPSVESSPSTTTANVEPLPSAASASAPARPRPRPKPAKATHCDQYVVGKDGKLQFVPECAQ